MFETLIPADLSDPCNATLAVARIEGLVNVALREEVFNYGNAMCPRPIDGEAKVSIAIGAAVPTASGLQVRITATATYIYPSSSHEEAASWQSLTSTQETVEPEPSTIPRQTEVQV